MLRKVLTMILIGLTVGLFSLSAVAKKPGETDGDPAYNGNGAPSGPHFNLNLIGMENPKGKAEADTGNSNGKRIFVKLSGNTKILLKEGPYDVIDYDGTDGTATFQLPNPEPSCKGGSPSCDGKTEYSVYARALGNSGSATITTCASDDGTYDGPGGDDYCSTAGYLLVGGGGSKFQNVSRDLLYVTGDFGDGIKRYPLFGDSLYDYYWDYENDGLRLAQLRFYELETDLSSEFDCECLFPVEED